MDPKNLTDYQLLVLILNIETFVLKILWTHGPSHNVTNLRAQAAEYRAILRERDPKRLAAWAPLLDLLDEFTLPELCVSPQPIRVTTWDPEGDDYFEFPGSTITPFGPDPDEPSSVLHE